MNSSSKNTYHVVIGKRRTTVCLDKILSDMVSLMLDSEPETSEAVSTVRKYLQEKLDRNNDPRRSYVTRWLREQVILDLAPNGFSGPGG